ncbi:MAG: substrate-binding domain-containing protein [Phycisphaerae bacterium]|nr:substrate-binding domain-containing protein [Phycisphaerae bacterium]
MSADQLVAALRRAIRSHLPGSALPGHQQLAALYHVTTHTVRRAEAILAAEGLIELRARSGAIIQPQQRCEQAVARIVAVGWAEERLRSFQQMVRAGAERQAGRYQLPLRWAEFASDEAIDWVDREIRDEPDRVGVIFANVVPPSDSLAEWGIRGVRMVMVDDTSQQLRIHTVCFDVQQAIFEATELLLRLGHCRIGYLGGPARSDTVSTARRRGFDLALVAHGRTVDPRWRTQLDFRGDDSTGAIRHWLTRNPDLSAIVAEDVRLGCQAIRACDQLGLDVPAAMSVVSGGARRPNMPAETGRLSRFDQGSPEQLGQLAVDVLAQTNPGDEQVRLVLGCRWLDHGSIGPPMRHERGT